ncbi:LOW QUALITY PROTEIN: hypothetical protein ACHAWC_005260 [Mediolabrus comicus]
MASADNPPPPLVKLSITASHDGGNIQLVSQTEPTISGRSAKCTVKLNVTPDVYTDLESIAHSNIFHFVRFGLHSSTTASVVGEGEESVDNSIKLFTVTYIIDNADKVSYPEAWPGTTICETKGSLEPADDQLWKRNPTTKYVDGKLTWQHVHTTNGSTFFSYFPPYTYNRHLKLIADCALSIAAKRDGNYKIESLGQTLQGREMECISVGNGDKAGWIIHRQHPGETMAEFFAEGLLHRLLGIGKDGESDDMSKKLLDQYRLYIVPCMCPDGAVMGHLRTNSVGANLNREWATVNPDYVAPSMERSPEVYAVLKKMDETGCDFFLDVHGDEELPYVFLSGAEKTPLWEESERIKYLHGYFVSCYQRANSDIQKNIGYPPPDSTEDALKYMNVATNQVSNRFKCLGLTLEMPYKDCATNPDPIGWSPERSKNLGASLVETLIDMHPYLRAEGSFWDEFSDEDHYVEPTDNFKEEGFVMLKKRLYSDVRPQSLG